MFNAGRRIFVEEGFSSLFKGAVPLMARGMSMNLGMFAFYETSKEILTEAMPEN